MSKEATVVLSILIVCGTLFMMYIFSLESKEKLAYIEKGYVEQIHKIKPGETGSYTYWVKPKEAK